MIQPLEVKACEKGCPLYDERSVWSIRQVCKLDLLSHNAKQRFVAGGAVEGEGDLVVAFGNDGVGEFDDDLGEGEVGDGEDGFDDEWVEVVIVVFKLYLDG